MTEQFDVQHYHACDMIRAWFSRARQWTTVGDQLLSSLHRCRALCLFPALGRGVRRCRMVRDVGGLSGAGRKGTVPAALSFRSDRRSASSRTDTSRLTRTSIRTGA
jgi:hypothetical protein